MSFLLGSCCAASGRSSKRDRELLSSGRTEIVAGAADRDDERIVGNGVRRRDLLALRVKTAGSIDAVKEGRSEERPKLGRKRPTRAAMPRRLSQLAPRLYTLIQNVKYRLAIMQFRSAKNMCLPI